jgi:hypothetical protein
VRDRPAGLREADLRLVLAEGWRCLDETVAQLLTILLDIFRIG